MIQNDASENFSEIQRNDKLIVERICSDDNYAYYFFHTKCRPLLSKIVWTVYKSNANYEELVNSLYEYLKKPGKDGKFWYRLRTFDFRTTLFDWIKVVAFRLFYTPSAEKFNIPQLFIDNGIAEELISCLSKSVHRKYLCLRYIQKLSNRELSIKLEMDQKDLLPLSRCAIKSLKTLLQYRFPEYYNSFFSKDELVFTDIDSHPELDSPDNTTQDNESSLDVEKYLEAMPNKRYRYIIQSLFLEEKSPEQLAKELETPISNIYNLKARAIDQLRDIAIKFREVPNFEKYINFISDDIKRNIMRSIFVDNKSYDEICSSLQISEVKLKKMKKEAIAEIKNIIFKK